MRTMTAILLAVLLGPVAAAQQICSDDIDRQAPASKFNALDELAYDPRNGLLWQRCPVGFEFSDGGTVEILADDTCTPSEVVEFDWATALTDVATLNANGDYLGYDGWRLPNTKELNTLFEPGCVWPAINLEVFPDTPTGQFWTNTPWRDSSAMRIDFSQGHILSSGKQNALYVRLVYDGPVR